MSLEAHKMSEEEFKPIRITLSEEAFNRLNAIMKAASFRSYSSAIEECIRVVYDTTLDIWEILGKKDAPVKDFTQTDVNHAFFTIAVRMERITGRTATYERM
jgi:hypothetical protein